MRKQPKKALKMIDYNPKLDKNERLVANLYFQKQRWNAGWRGVVSANDYSYGTGSVVTQI